MFSRDAQPSAWPLADGSTVWVIDDVLADPREWVDTAAQGQHNFSAPSEGYYPGVEWPLAQELVQPLAEFFAQHVRSRLGARRTLASHARLSMTTLQPGALRPLQRLCHRDRYGRTPDTMMAACTLYLFDDPSLGGTSFYAPRRPLADIDADVLRWDAMSGADFTHDTGLDPAYMTRSNAHFELTGVVPARFNRAVFHDGDIFHSAHIERPDRLNADPRRGRLTLNGFFECRPRSGLA